MNWPSDQMNEALYRLGSDQKNWPSDQMNEALYRLGWIDELAVR